LTEAEELMILEAEIDDLRNEVRVLRDRLASKESLLAATKQRRDAVRAEKWKSS
jgi:hypothetical protein